jgi:hypothetical protein
MRIATASLFLLLSACVIEAPPQREVLQEPGYQPPQSAYEPPPQSASEPPGPPPQAVYEEPPVQEPAPIAVGWAPPPMLVEVPPPPPFPEAVWVGGYWVWRGDWVWAQGHWMGPPRAQYLWVHPYYEHRGEEVVFINGYWSAPGVAFVPPPPGMLVVEPAAVGVMAGPRPIGPDGCFVPPPPGSRRGIIIPAPIGTAPAVVTSAPPVVAVGMRITHSVTNITNVTNVTQVTNITNVTIIAPPGATASGRAFSSQVPAAAHLAASRPAVVQARAPQPASTQPVAPYRSVRTPEAQPPHAPPAAPPPRPTSTYVYEGSGEERASGAARTEAGAAEEEIRRTERLAPAEPLREAPVRVPAEREVATREAPPRQEGLREAPAHEAPPRPASAAAPQAPPPAHPDNAKQRKIDDPKDDKSKAADNERREER